MKSSCGVTLLVLLAGVPTASFGQLQTPAPAGAADDVAWSSLVAAVNQSPIPDTSGSPVASLIAKADEAAGFVDAKPGRPHANDAKAFEGILLGRAVLAGDNTHEARRDAIVFQLRQNKTVSTAVRLELFATSASADIALAKYPTRDEFVAAHETAARALIAEFPAESLGYESLVAIARSGPEARAATIARDLLAMPGVPASVLTDAQDIIDRAAVVGQSVAPLGSSGHAVVIYTWSVFDRGSIKRVQAVAANAGKSVAFVGVNVDGTPADATAQRLPGTQVPVTDSTILRLKLTRPGLIYGADAGGVLRSVHLDYDLGAAFLATNS